MNAVILNGVFLGCIYGLLGIGLVVAYRGSRVINFANSQIGTIAAFLYLDFRFGTHTETFSLNPVDHGSWFAFPASIAVAAILGLVTERIIVRPLRDAPRIRALVGTFAIGSLFLIYAGRRWGTDPRATGTLVTGDGFTVAGLHVQPQQVLVLVVTVVVLIGLWALDRFTSFGLRLRALASDPYGAGIVGVNVNRTSMAVWALAGGLAGLAAILISPLTGLTLGTMAALSIRGLAAALVGGLTSVWATFWAGIAIGVVGEVIKFKSPVVGMADVILAGVILVLMVIRPTGLARATA